MTFIKGQKSPFKGKKHTIKSKEKNRLAHLGKHYSPETEFKKGSKLSDKQRKKIGDGLKKLFLNGRKNVYSFPKGHKINVGRKQSEEWKKKKGLSQLGSHRSEETRKKMSNSAKGEKCHFWKGGITPINTQIRISIEYRLWREAVFARDEWICQKTRTKGLELEAHHIQNFSQFPKLRFAIDNGITLSKKSHKLFHKIYGQQNNTKSQLKEFLQVTQG